MFRQRVAFNPLPVVFVLTAGVSVLQGAEKTVLKDNKILASENGNVNQVLVNHKENSMNFVGSLECNQNRNI
jgi:hypothetical protein